MTEKNNISLSIIIPAYNVENYIEATLESVYTQQTHYSFETIVIDDGSTDNTPKIIKKAVKYYHNLKYFRIKNSGAGAARNCGIKLAQGKYIYFFDGDDLLDTNLIETTLNIMEKENLDVLMFAGKSFLDKRLKESSFFPNYSRLFISTTNGPKLINTYLKEKKGYSVSPCLFISKAEHIKSNNIFFPEGIIYEDNYFVSVNFFKAKRIKSIKNVLYLRRIRSNSIMTGTKIEKKFCSACMIIDYFYKFINSIHFKGFSFILDNFINEIEKEKYVISKQSFLENESLYKRTRVEYIRLRGIKKYVYIYTKRMVQRYLLY